jgi:hypothetical protein
MVLSGKAGGHDGNDVFRDIAVFKIHRRDFQVVSERCQQLVFRDDIQIYQRVSQAAASRFLVIERLLQLILRDDVIVYKEFSEPHFVFRHEAVLSYCRDVLFSMRYKNMFLFVFTASVFVVRVEYPMIWL